MEKCAIFALAVCLYLFIYASVMLDALRRRNEIEQKTVDQRIVYSWVSMIICVLIALASASWLWFFKGSSSGHLVGAYTIDL